MEVAYLYVFVVSKLNAGFRHPLTQHIVHKQPIEPLLAPLFKLYIFESLTFEQTSCMGNADFGSMKPELFFRLKVRELRNMSDNRQIKSNLSS